MQKDFCNKICHKQTRAVQQTRSPRREATIVASTTLAPSPEIFARATSCVTFSFFRMNSLASNFMLLRPSLSASGRFTLLLAFAFAFLLLAIQRDLNIYDEGSILVGAMRVADGEIPHRDFFTLYGPAQFYVLASLFKLFSPSVLGERLWDTLVRALVAAYVFLIVEKCGGRREAYFASAASLIWLGFFAFYGYPAFPALLFALISAFFLLHVFQGGRRALMLLASGASVGLIALFRYEIGFVAFVTESSVVGAYVLTQKNTIREKLVVLAHILLPYSLVFAAVFLPVAVGYLIYAPLADFVFDVVSHSH